MKKYSAVLLLSQMQKSGNGVQIVYLPDGGPCDALTSQPFILIFCRWQVHGIKTDADVRNAASARAAPPAFAAVESKVHIHTVCIENPSTAPVY